MVDVFDLLEEAKRLDEEGSCLVNSPFSATQLLE
jgi:hypothetical protein